MTDFYLPPVGSEPPSEEFPVSATADETPAAYYGKTWAFDFDAGDFIVDDETGYVATTSADGAVEQALVKQLMTERFRWLAYGDNYGNETAGAIADAPIGADPEDLALSYAEETVSSDPRVSTSTGLDVDVDSGAETVHVTGVVIDTYGVDIYLDATYSYVATP